MSKNTKKLDVPPRTYIPDAPQRRAPPVPDRLTRHNPDVVAKIEELKRMRAVAGQPVIDASSSDFIKPSHQTTTPSRSQPTLASNRHQIPVETTSQARDRPQRAEKLAQIESSSRAQRSKDVDSALSRKQSGEPVLAAKRPTVSRSNSQRQRSVPDNTCDEISDYYSESKPSAKSKSTPNLVSDVSKASSSSKQQPVVDMAEKQISLEKKEPYLPISDVYRAKLCKTLLNMAATEGDSVPVTRADFLTEDGYFNWLDDADKRGGDHRFEPVVADMLRLWDIKYPILSSDHLNAPGKKAAVFQKPAFTTAVNLSVSVLEAKGLLEDSKGRPRNCFAVIEYPSAQGEMLRYETKPVPNTNSPVWKQHIALNVTNLTDTLKISVFHLKEKSGIFGDDFKEEFLGSASFEIQKIVSEAAKSGFINKWYALSSDNPDKEKNRGKIVQGQLHLEFEMAGVVTKGNESTSGDELELPEDFKKLAEVQHRLISSKVQLKSLFAVLMRAVVSLDICIPAGKDFTTIDITRLRYTLSTESEAVLDEFARIWSISDMFQKMKYLQCVFDKYKEQRTHANALLAAYRVIYQKVFKKGSVWLATYEQPILFQCFTEIESYCTDQIRNFKAYFPPPKKLTAFGKNHIDASLKCILLLTRMIDKNPFFLSGLEDKQEAVVEEGMAMVKIGITTDDYKNGSFSFTEKIYGIVQSKAVSNYQTMSEMASSIDGSDTVAGLLRQCSELTRLIMKELDVDQQVYKAGFSDELDVLGISVKAYIPNLQLELQNMARLVQTEIKTNSSLFTEALDTPATLSPKHRSAELLAAEAKTLNAPSNEDELIAMAFDLMKMLQELQSKINGYGLNNTEIKFDMVHCFSPFIMRWLELTEKKTVEWVTNAVNVDQFNPQVDGNPTSSVTDLFSAIFSALEFFQRTLSGWEKYETHYALFMTRFAQIVYKAVQNYCVKMEELPARQSSASQNAGAVAGEQVSKMWNWVTGSTTAPAQGEISEASDPLAEEFHRQICVRLANIYALSHRVKSVFQEMKGPQMVAAASNWRKRKMSSLPKGDTFSGLLRIRFVCAENLKAKGAFGKTSPYVVLKRQQADGKVTAAKSEASNGLNPIWSFANPRIPSRTSYPFMREPSQYIVPVVDCSELELSVYHKVNSNATFSFMSGSEDVLLGTGVVKISKEVLKKGKEKSRWIELNTQGKVLILIDLVSEGVSGLDRKTGADGISFGLAGSEDADYWFRKMEAAIDTSRYNLVSAIVDDVATCLTPHFTKIIKDAAMTSATNEQSVVTIEQADLALAPIAAYLNQSLGLFANALPTKLVQYVVLNVYRRNVLNVVLQYVNPVPFHADSVPAIAGTSMIMSQASKTLDARQHAMLLRCIQLLVQFFHAGGTGSGLPLAVLQDASCFIPGDRDRCAELSKQLFPQ